MASKMEMLSERYEIDIDERMFNEVYRPYLDKIYRYEVYYGGSGSGKCFARDTGIVMYDGRIKRVQDIIVGDILMGPDSRPRHVLRLTRGEGQLYKVTQNKGIDYVVNGEHILCLKKSRGCTGRTGQKVRYPGYKDYVEISVKDYLSQSARWKRNFLGYRACVEFKGKELLLDPYYLGLWLGDGTSESTSITTEDSEIITYLKSFARNSNEKHSIKHKKNNTIKFCFDGYSHPDSVKREWAKIIAYIDNNKKTWRMSVSSICRETGFSRKVVYYYKKQEDFIKWVSYYKENPEPFDLDIIKKRVNSTSILGKLKGYNIINNKHIPDDFLYSDRESRLLLLAGIIDTDGSLQGNCYDIVQKNKKLSEQIVYLSNSLGFRASIKECIKKCCNNGKSGTYYRINISGNTQDIPVKIERKKIKTYNKLVDPMSTGIKVEKDRIGEFYGFQVDGDNKFLLSDFTVAHNSTFIGQKLSLQMTLLGGRNLVALRKQKTDCRDSCYPEIKNAMKQLGLIKFWKVVEHPNIEMTNRLNGNKIIFSGMDDVENIKSIKFENVDEETGIGGNLTDVWYEEATEEDQAATIRELDRRLRDLNLKCRIILSFNPIYNTHWIKEFIEKELKGKDVLVLKTTYLHNKFLPKEYVDVLLSYKVTDPYSYMVYALGEWGMTGRTVFDANKINDRLMVLYDLYRKSAPRRINFGYDRDDKDHVIISSFKAYTFAEGDTMVFEEPKSRVPYVMAFDTAGEGSDRYAAHIRDNRTGKQVARYLSEANPDECVLQLFGLAKYYNDALVCPEANFDSYPIKKFQELGYTNFYMRDKSPDDIGGVMPVKIGFLTTSGNRQRILSELVEWVSLNVNLINDIDTLNEMMTFTRQAKKQKGIFWAAAPGSHDDLVMSFAILLQAAEQQVTDSVPESKPLEGVWLQEELEMAYAEGKITYEEMERFKKTKGYIGERVSAIPYTGGSYDF